MATIYTIELNHPDTMSTKTENYQLHKGGIYNKVVFNFIKLETITSLEISPEKPH